MTSWIDPNLLQLFGLGLQTDALVPDGRHLRWFPGRLLGFPRSGFRLRRRPSYAIGQWPAADPLIRLQRTSQAELVAGTSRRFPNGITVGHATGFAYEAVTTGSPLLRVDDVPVTLDFGPEGSPPFAPGPGLSNPAAFVLLTIARRKNTGWVSATAASNAGTEYRALDRGAVGTPTLTWMPSALAAKAAPLGGALRLRSSAERALDASAIGARDAAVRAELARAGFALHAPHALREPGTAPGAVNTNTWVLETLLLDGGIIDHVELVGHDAALVQAQWIPVRDYANTAAWTDLGRFYLPLTNAPTIYPAWTATAGEDVAKQRLDLALPLKQAPWDDPPTPPATVTPAVIAADLAKRYLGNAFKDVDDALRLFLAGELAFVLPQALVESTDTLESDDGDPESAVKAVTRPFEHVYGAAADPEVARLLGLMTSDFTDAFGTYDYVIDADFPRLWIDWTVQPKLAGKSADDWRTKLGGKPLTWFPAGGKPTSTSLPVENVLSMVTAIVCTGGLTLPAPEDLSARVYAEPVALPVQARAEVSWKRSAFSLFEEPERALVLYSFLRSDGTTEAKLHYRDDDSKLLLPHVPTDRAARDGRLRLVDRQIPKYGSYTWRVAGLDIWGRLSPYASADADVRDEVPPPAPASVTAALSGPASGAPVFTEVVITCDVSEGVATLAPDLSKLEFHLRQGDLSVAEGEAAGAWGRFEHTTGATTPPLGVSWPAGTLDALPAGLTGSATLSAIPAADGGGSRVTLRVGPIHAPFSDAGVARVSATARAVDEASNASPFALRAVAQRFEETAPPPPPLPSGVAWATRADALGRSFYRVSWPDLGRGRVQVMRASEAALLDAGGTDPAVYAALDLIARAELLRGVAIGHPERFVADHEFPYAAAPGGHAVELGGAERALTVVTLSPVGQTEQRAPWPAEPARFAVIAVPAAPALRPPLLRELRAGDRRVSARVAPDLTGATARLRLYRARRAEDAKDVRRMRLVSELSVGPPVGSPPPDLLLSDGSVFADVDYWYRVVALAEGGEVSPPSGERLARPFSSEPPPAPAIVSVKRHQTQPRRQLTCVVARRDYALALFRRERGELSFRFGTGPELGEGGAIDLGALATEPVTGGWRFVVEDSVPDMNADYFYFLRMRDGRGRTSDSEIQGDQT
jgi:hypothetical protein